MAERSGLEKEVLKRTSVKYRGKNFYVTVTDRDKVTIDGMLDDGNSDGVRRWILRHMRVINDAVPPEGNEGAAFQADLKRFLAEFGV